MNAPDPLTALLNILPHPLADFERQQAERQKQIDDNTKVIRERALEVAAHAIQIAQNASWCRGEVDLLAIALDDLKAAALIVDPPWKPNEHDADEYRVMNGEARERLNAAGRKEPV